MKLVEIKIEIPPPLTEKGIYNLENRFKNILLLNHKITDPMEITHDVLAITSVVSFCASASLALRSLREFLKATADKSCSDEVDSSMDLLSSMRELRVSPLSTGFTSEATDTQFCREAEVAWNKTREQLKKEY